MLDRECSVDVSQIEVESLVSRKSLVNDEDE